MAQKKKQPTAQAPEPLYDIFATAQSRRLFWSIAIVLCALGYILTVWSNLYFGTGMPLKQALLRSFTTMLFVIGMQAPVWFWYRKRMKGSAPEKH